LARKVATLGAVILESALKMLVEYGLLLPVSMELLVRFPSTEDAIAVFPAASSLKKELVSCELRVLRKVESDESG
jgi:hypothetical protein